jgi:hypothetical protein
MLVSRAFGFTTQTADIGNMGFLWRSGRSCSNSKVVGVLYADHLSRKVTTSNGWLIMITLAAQVRTRVGSVFVGFFATCATWGWVVSMINLRCFVQRLNIWKPARNEDLRAHRRP